MPKNKTHSGASKRFRVTGSGKIRRQKAGLRHNLEKKPSKVTRRMTRHHRGRQGRRQARQEAARSLSPHARPPIFDKQQGVTQMARVKRAVNAHKKRRITLERASGYRGQRSRLYRKAKEQVTHSLVYSYNDRRKNKGNFRRLWIQRINAAARAHGMTYNRFIQGLKPGRCRGRPQDPGRPGRQRRAGLQRARRDRQGARCPRTSTPPRPRPDATA